MKVLHIEILDETLRASYEHAIKCLEKQIDDGGSHMDSGFDIFMPESVRSERLVWGRSTRIFPLGIRCAMFPGRGASSSSNGESLPFYVYPRSSIGPTPLRLANSVGIIDSGYRGELIGVLDNISDTPYQIASYQRLLQICLPDLSPFRVKIVDELSRTWRGSGRFGSTGIIGNRLS